MPVSPGSKPRPEGLGPVLDALPIGLYVVDRDLVVRAWNRGREQGPIGRPRGRAVGRPLKAVLGAAGYRATEPVLREVFRTGRPHEEIVETKGGLFHVRRLPVRRGRREVTHVVSWFDDITARREIEMRLIASDRLSFLGQLVSGVAHEISNPLAGIAGCAEALASLAAKGERRSAREARQFRDLIRTEVARCEKIVRFLLDSSRSAPGDRADLEATVSLALRLLERHPALARLRVRASVPKGLPPARIDTDSLKQVVMALAMNACSSMPDRGHARRARLAPWPDAPPRRRRHRAHGSVATAGAPLRAVRHRRCPAGGRPRARHRPEPAPQPRGRSPLPAPEGR